MVNYGLKVNIATDFSGGNRLSMLNTLDAAYKIAQLNNFSLHPSYAFYMCTKGAALNLGIDKEVGNIEKGLIADLVVLDNCATERISWRSTQCKSIFDLLFLQMTLGDDRSIKHVNISQEIKFMRKIYSTL